MPEDGGQEVLIADDDPSILELVTATLALAGYRTRGVSDGKQAVMAVMAQRPDAMILDLNMPELDGFAVLQRLTVRGFLPGLPVMVLTARHEVYDVAAAIKLGARDYLAKPFEDQVLLRRVARLLRGEDAS